MAYNQSETTQTEKIISHFFLKTLQSVLTSRIPRLAGARRSHRWFNLAVGDLPPALHLPDFSHESAMDPMILDIILSSRDGLESTAVIERWITQCDSPLHHPSSSSPSFYRKTYRKCILLLRSIYCILRLLPAYKAFRLLSSCSNQSSGSNYDLSYKFSSVVEPFSRDEEKGFKLQTFSPVESELGHLSVSVLYRPSLENFNLEVSSLSPPLIIVDYVGSPAADPMRAFPASPVRPHSWTTTTERRMSSSPVDCFGQRMGVPRGFGSHRKGGNFGFEEYRLSPPMSASPTPSPPAHRLRSETSPVSIPQPGKNQLHRIANFSDPTRSLLPPPSPRSARGDASLEESHSARSFKKVGNLHSLLYTAPKGLKDAKDDSGRFSSVLSSCGSPRFVSRSSSRKSLQDDLEDFDFSCPFAVDDVDISESQIRHHDIKDASESAQASPHGSQDAAVGALVHMLKTAPSLRQDQSLSSLSSKSEVNSEASTCSFFSSRKKSDALEELRGYRDMKEVILSKSRIQMLDPQKQATE